VSDHRDDLLAQWPELVRRIRERTPARVLMGRSGAAYRTDTQLDLREAHAGARDAVNAELDMEPHLGRDCIERWKLFEVSTLAQSKQEYLLKPNLGRAFSEAGSAEILRYCTTGVDLQIAIGDGLSVTAVAEQVPELLPHLYEGAKARGWTVGRAFVIRHCRVGILNEIGELLAPKVALLLIGERPGLATAESLSGYMAYEPKRTHTDADRNLVSNIHRRGIATIDAATRLLEIAGQMMTGRCSGTRLAGANILLP
jgi:ethanolamine ammonia-lyase small subunit